MQHHFRSLDPSKMRQKNDFFCSGLHFDSGTLKKKGRKKVKKIRSLRKFNKSFDEKMKLSTLKEIGRLTQTCSSAINSFT